MKQRISILFDKAMLDSLDAISNNIGLPKSKLITEWLYSTEVSIHDLSLEVSNYKKTVCYNLRLEKKLFERCESCIANSNFSVSSYIRAVINKNISTNIATKNISPKDMWNRGNLLELTHEFNPMALSRMNLQDTFAIIRSFITIDEGKLSRESINFLKEYYSKSKQNSVKVLLKLLDVFFEIELEHNFKAAQQILEGVNIEHSDIRRQLTGVYYFQMGEIYINDEKFYEAKQSLDKAMEYFDVVNFPVDIIKTYIRYSRLYKIQNYHEIAENYLYKALEVANRFNNGTYRAIILHTLIAQKGLDYKIDKVLNQINAVSELSKNLNLVSTLYSSQIVHSRLLFSNGNREKADLVMKEALKHISEKKYGAFAETSLTNMFRAFYSYVQDPNQGERTFDKLKKNNSSKNYLLFNMDYYLNAGRYLLNDNPEIQELGRNGLMLITKQTNSDLRKNAVLHTLKTRKLSYFR